MLALFEAGEKSAHEGAWEGDLCLVMMLKGMWVMSRRQWGKCMSGGGAAGNAADVGCSELDSDFPHLD